MLAARGCGPRPPLRRRTASRSGTGGRLGVGLPAVHDADRLVQLADIDADDLAIDAGQRVHLLHVLVGDVGGGLGAHVLHLRQGAGGEEDDHEQGQCNRLHPSLQGRHYNPGTLASATVGVRIGRARRARGRIEYRPPISEWRLTSGARIGPYEVLALLGAGGMGEVYRARDTTLDREVAIKVLPDLFASDAERLARFTREAQTLAALNHPNIAHIHGLEDNGGVRALVMELVEGEDLSQRLARGALPLDEALPIARQIAEALEAAHEQGIVHRDLKPANIKLRPTAS